MFRYGLAECVSKCLQKYFLLLDIVDEGGLEVYDKVCHDAERGVTWEILNCAVSQ